MLRQIHKSLHFYEGAVKPTYFVAETKGSMRAAQLRPIEQSKILFAKGHFKVSSGSHVVFEVVDSYKLPPLFNRTAGAIFLTRNILMALKQTLR